MLEIQVIWDVMQCWWLSSSPCFEGTWLLHVWSQAVGLLDAQGEGAVQNTGNYSSSTTVPHLRKFQKPY